MYKDKNKAREYNKLLRRKQRGSKLAIAGKSILEQTYENLRNKEVKENE